VQVAAGFPYSPVLKLSTKENPMTSILKSPFLRSLIGVAAVAISCQAAAQVTFYENNDFQGRSFATGERVANFRDAGFNDRASSVIVLSRRWEVCEHAQFDGRCVVLRPGRYPSLESMGMNNSVSSIRAVNNRTRINDDRFAPPAPSVYDNRRRNNERLYQADVTSVRAVVGPPEQRCWIEREQVVQPNPVQGQSGSNVPGALVGALIGGILGHQVGNGRGNELATVGGAIAGGAIGAQVGRDGAQQQAQPQQYQTQGVRRCTNVPSQARPELWDVSYTFRGIDHRLQMTTPPGPTVTVNRQGEPRA
jgi:uncharacterized protein YcfJ